MKIQKILIINTKYRIFGGEDSNIVDEIKLLDKYFQVFYLEFDNSKRINIYDIFSFFSFSNFNSNKILKKTIDEFNPDFVYVHNLWFKANLGVLKILKKKPLVILHKIHNYRFQCSRYFLSKNHLKNQITCLACGIKISELGIFNKYFKESYIKSFLLILHSKKYTKLITSYPLIIIAMSNFQVKKLIEYGIEDKKIKIYPNPIETLDNNLKYDSNSRYVLVVSRLVENKGILEIISKWEEAKLSNLILKVIGSGELKEELLKKYTLKNIEFVGELSNTETKKLMSKARAVIFASKLFEGQPRVLLEAISFGIPTIYPKFAGMSEFFPKNYDLSFTQFDYDDLYEKIIKLEDTNFLINESLKLSDFVQKNLNESQYINKFKNILGE